MEALIAIDAASADSRDNLIVADFELAPTLTDDGLTIETTGKMSIVGVERPVIMTVKTERLPDGTRRARGAVPIRMSDFGIVPRRGSGC